MIEYRDLRRLIDNCEKTLFELKSTIFSEVAPSNKPYSLAYHILHSVQRLRDCRRILKVLYHKRRHLTKIERSKKAICGPMYPSDWKDTPKMRRLQKRSEEIGYRMRMEMEALYIFGGMLLDQWAYTALHIAGDSKPDKGSFHNLVLSFEKNQIRVKRIKSIWNECKSEILWLDYQIRYYRNRFIVHIDRPLSRGFNSSLFGDDFRLSSRAPVGWIDEKKRNAEIRKLVRTVPKRIRELDSTFLGNPRPRALLVKLFDSIGIIESRQDREKVYKLFNKIGGMTPSFQVIANRMLEFIKSATEMLIGIAMQHPKHINLGKFRDSNGDV